MKKIISGKRYDTDTATLVGSNHASCYCSDFHYWEENLYRTKAGAWFVHGEGNGLSRWSSRFADGSGPGSGIRVLSASEARDWLEEAGLHDEIEENFADQIVDA